ncbi:cell division cycle- protein [Neophaeococcomyces mojaviensis]|uniref:Cell division cycle- protein n=1 Tax=Neophaeococcomyces mojaviensis TaxID=3383035 RepID=A0ACC3A799_9EURO|nr:cell division cycle- protein [Knufia sp. JES_112]
MNNESTTQVEQEVDSSSPPMDPLMTELLDSAADYCWAICDYTAASPAELNLQAGDKIEVLDRDTDHGGWWYGCIGTSRGWIPSNYCTSAPASYVRALLDFESDASTELDLRRGDVVAVSQRAESGWWYGWIGIRSGWFPSNYCDMIDEDDMDDVDTPDGSETGDDEFDAMEEESYRTGIWL